MKNMKEIILQERNSVQMLQAFMFLCCHTIIQRGVMMFGQEEFVTMCNKVNTMKRNLKITDSKVSNKMIENKFAIFFNFPRITKI